MPGPVEHSELRYANAGRKNEVEQMVMGEHDLDVRPRVGRNSDGKIILILSIC